MGLFRGKWGVQEQDTEEYSLEGEGIPLQLKVTIIGPVWILVLDPLALQLG